MKAYIANESKSGAENIEGVYYLITEEGECLATHWCSNSGYALGDLYKNRPERIKEFTDRFGDFEVNYLGHDDMTAEKLIELNHKFAEEHYK